jgi:hypothetical protein
MNEILLMLKEQYLWDIAQFSSPWMYWFVIPIMLFVPFFVLKWAMLTLPLWLPVAMVIRPLIIKATPSIQSPALRETARLIRKNPRP